MATTLLYLVFVLSAILLITVILLQEGKGGGLGDAFGGAGQQTFGVGTRGITRFTGWVTVVFLVSAVGIHLINKQSGGSILDSERIDAPADPLPATAPATPPQQPR